MELIKNLWGFDVDWGFDEVQTYGKILRHEREFFREKQPNRQIEGIFRERQIAEYNGY
jgi:hypothetical protein